MGKLVFNNLKMTNISKLDVLFQMAFIVVIFYSCFVVKVKATLYNHNDSPLSYRYIQLSDSQISAALRPNDQGMRYSSGVVGGDYDYHFIPPPLNHDELFQPNLKTATRARHHNTLAKRMTSPSPPPHVPPFPIAALALFNMTYTIVKESGKPCFPMDSCERPDLLGIVQQKQRQMSGNAENSAIVTTNIADLLDIDLIFSSHKRLKNCECDTLCQIYGDCCADYPVLAATLAKLSTLPSPPPKTSPKKKPPMLAVKAAKKKYRHRQAFDEHSRRNYEFSCNHVTGLYEIYMIDTCPRGMGANPKYKQLVALCERRHDSDDFSEPLAFVPYTDARTNFTYRNLWCALCHEASSFLFQEGEEGQPGSVGNILSSIVPWSSTIHCNFVPDIRSNHSHQSASTTNMTPTETFLSMYLGSSKNGQKAKHKNVFKYDEIYRKFLVWEFQTLTTIATATEGSAATRMYCWWKFSHPSMTIVTSRGDSSSMTPLRRKKDTPLRSSTDSVSSLDTNVVIGVRKCVPNVIDSCDRSRPISNLSYNSILSGSSTNGGLPALEDIATKCNSYTALVYSARGIYKNAHCALCNGEIASLSDLSCYDIFSSPPAHLTDRRYVFANDAAYSRSSWSLTPTSTFTWKVMEDGNVADPIRGCGPGHVWNPFSHICMRLHYCSHTSRYDEVKGACIKYTGGELSTLIPDLVMGGGHYHRVSPTLHPPSDEENLHGAGLYLDDSEIRIDDSSLRLLNSFGKNIACAFSERIAWKPGTYNLDRRAFPLDVVYLSPAELYAKGIVIFRNVATPDHSSNNGGPVALNPGEFYFVQGEQQNWPPDASLLLISKRDYGDNSRHQQQAKNNPPKERDTTLVEKTNGGDALLRFLDVKFLPTQLGRGKKKVSNSDSIRKKSNKRRRFLGETDAWDVTPTSLNYRVDPDSHTLYVCKSTLTAKGAAFVRDGTGEDSNTNNNNINKYVSWRYICNRKRIISYLSLILSAALFLSADILTLFNRLLQSKWSSHRCPKPSVTSGGGRGVKKGTSPISLVSDTGCLLTWVHIFESALLNGLLILALFYFNNTSNMGGGSAPSTNRRLTNAITHQPILTGGKQFDKLKEVIFRSFSSRGTDNCEALLTFQTVSALEGLTLTTASNVSQASNRNSELPILNHLLAKNAKLNSRFSVKLLQPLIMFYIFSNLLWIIAFTLNRFFNALLNYRRYQFNESTGNIDRNQEIAVNLTDDPNEDEDMTAGSRSVFSRKYTTYDLWGKRVSKSRPWTRYLILQMATWVSAFLITALFYTSIVAMARKNGGNTSFKTLVGNLNDTVLSSGKQLTGGLFKLTPVKRYLFYGGLDSSDMYHDNYDAINQHDDGRSGSANMIPLMRQCNSCTCLPPVNPFFGVAFLVPVTLFTTFVALILTLAVVWLNRKRLLRRRQLRHNRSPPPPRSILPYSADTPTPHDGDTTTKEGGGGSSSSSSPSSCFSQRVGGLKSPPVLKESSGKGGISSGGVHDSRGELISSSSQNITTSSAHSSRADVIVNSSFDDDDYHDHCYRSKKETAGGERYSQLVIDLLCCRNYVLSRSSSSNNNFVLVIGMTDFFTLLLIALTFAQYALLGASSTVFSNKYSYYHRSSYLSPLSEPVGGGMGARATVLDETSSGFRDNSCTVFWILYLVLSNFQALAFFIWCLIRLHHRGRRLRSSNKTKSSSTTRKGVDKDNNNNYLNGSEEDQYQKRRLLFPDGAARSDDVNTEIERKNTTGGFGHLIYNPLKAKKGSYDVYKQERSSLNKNKSPDGPPPFKSRAARYLEAPPLPFHSEQGSNTTTTNDSNSSLSFNAAGAANFSVKKKPNKNGRGPKLPLPVKLTDGPVICPGDECFKGKREEDSTRYSSYPPPSYSTGVYHSSAQSPIPGSRHHQYTYDSENDKFMELVLGDEKAKLHSVREIEII